MNWASRTNKRGRLHDDVVERQAVARDSIQAGAAHILMRRWRPVEVLPRTHDGRGGITGVIGLEQLSVR